MRESICCPLSALNVTVKGAVKCVSFIATGGENVIKYIIKLHDKKLQSKYFAPTTSCAKRYPGITEVWVQIPKSANKNGKTGFTAQSKIPTQFDPT